MPVVVRRKSCGSNFVIVVKPFHDSWLNNAVWKETYVTVCVTIFRYVTVCVTIVYVKSLWSFSDRETYFLAFAPFLFCFFIEGKSNVIHGRSLTVLSIAVERNFCLTYVFLPMCDHSLIGKHIVAYAPLILRFFFEGKCNVIHEKISESAVYIYWKENPVR